MSTIAIILAHESAEPPLLRRFVPRLQGSEKERRMLTVVPTVFDWLVKPVKGDALNKVKAQARTHFGQFVKGLPIDDLYFMKRVEDRRLNPPDFSHEVWAISPRFSPPQYRYFGAFATQDWFIVCTKQSRDVLDEHENRWHSEIDRTRRIWSKLFGSILPHAGPQLRDYISFNASHWDDRW